MNQKGKKNTGKKILDLITLFAKEGAQLGFGEDPGSLDDSYEDLLYNTIIIDDPKNNPIAKNILVRPATTKDVEDIVKVEIKSWPVPIIEGGAMRATAEKFQNRIRIGGLLVAQYKGPKTTFTYKNNPPSTLQGDMIIGMISYQIIKCDIDLEELYKKQLMDEVIIWDDLIKMGLSKDWYEATDSGYVLKTHKPDGNTGFLIGVGITPEARGLKLVDKLVEAVLKNAKNKGLKQVIGYERLPGFHKYSDQMSIEDYFNAKREDTQYLDPVSRFHSRMGAKLLCTIPNAMYDDGESLGYGALAWYDLSRL